MNIDPATGLPIDPATGMPIEPDAPGLMQQGMSHMMGHQGGQQFGDLAGSYAVNAAANSWMFGVQAAAYAPMTLGPLMQYGGRAGGRVAAAGKMLGRMDPFMPAFRMGGMGFRAGVRMTPGGGGMLRAFGASMEAGGGGFGGAMRGVGSVLAPVGRGGDMAFGARAGRAAFNMGRIGAGIAGGIAAAAPPLLILEAGIQAAVSVGMEAYDAQNAMSIGQSTVSSVASRNSTITSQQAQGFGAGTMRKAASGMGLEMEQLEQLTKELGKMGSFRGASNLSEFSQKFTESLRQLKEMAKVANSTLGEALQLTQFMKSQGVTGGAATGMVSKMGAMSAATGLGMESFAQSGLAGAQMARQLGLNRGVGMDMYMKGLGAMEHGVQQGTVSSNLVDFFGGTEQASLMANTLTMQTAMGSQLHGYIMDAKAAAEGKTVVDQARLRQVTSGQVTQEQLKKVTRHQMSAAMSKVGRQTFAPVAMKSLMAYAGGDLNQIAEDFGMSVEQATLIDQMMNSEEAAIQAGSMQQNLLETTRARTSITAAQKSPFIFGKSLDTAIGATSTRWMTGQVRDSKRWFNSWFDQKPMLSIDNATIASARRISEVNPALMSDLVRGAGESGATFGDWKAGRGAHDNEAEEYQRYQEFKQYVETPGEYSDRITGEYSDSLATGVSGSAMTGSPKWLSDVYGAGKGKREGRDFMKAESYWGRDHIIDMAVADAATRGRQKGREAFRSLDATERTTATNRFKALDAIDDIFTDRYGGGQATIARIVQRQSQKIYGNQYTPWKLEDTGRRDQFGKTVHEGRRKLIAQRGLGMKDAGVFSDDWSFTGMNMTSGDLESLDRDAVKLLGVAHELGIGRGRKYEDIVRGGKVDPESMETLRGEIYEAGVAAGFDDTKMREFSGFMGSGTSWRSVGSLVGAEEFLGKTVDSALGRFGVADAAISEELKKDTTRRENFTKIMEYLDNGQLSKARNLATKEIRVGGAVAELYQSPGFKSKLEDLKTSNVYRESEGLDTTAKNRFSFGGIISKLRGAGSQADYMKVSGQNFGQIQGQIGAFFQRAGEVDPEKLGHGFMGSLKSYQEMHDKATAEERMSASRTIFEEIYDAEGDIEAEVEAAALATGGRSRAVTDAVDILLQGAKKGKEAKYFKRQDKAGFSYYGQDIWKDKRKKEHTELFKEQIQTVQQISGMSKKDSEEWMKELLSMSPQQRAARVLSEEKGIFTKGQTDVSLVGGAKGLGAASEMMSTAAGELSTAAKALQDAAVSLGGAAPSGGPKIGTPAEVLTDAQILGRGVTTLLESWN